jgi:hypothetical protein
MSHSMKTERITLLTTPEFKSFLAAEARREGVSVAELVRSRCEGRPGDDEAMLLALTAELKTAVARARKSLRDGLAEAETVLGQLRSQRAAQSRARQRARKSAERAAA